MEWVIETTLEIRFIVFVLQTVIGAAMCVVLNSIQKAYIVMMLFIKSK